MEPEHLPHLLAAIETGWTLGKQAKPLFAQKWEEVWDRPLVQLRQELHLVPAAPKASEGIRFSPPSGTATELNIRKAAIADIPFLARIQYEASLPPLNHCFWEDMLQGTGTGSLQFIEAMLRAEASNWGNVADYWVLEAQGKPVAAAAGYTPKLEDYCPLRLAGLDQIAQDLNWSKAVATTFRDRYLHLWQGNLQPSFLIPVADWIIENVAVLPEARGRGLAKVLLRALLEEGRSRQHSHAGIMVVNGNDVAYHTYQALGFKPYQTFHAQYFLDLFHLEFPGVTKLGLRLNETAESLAAVKSDPTSGT